VQQSNVSTSNHATRHTHSQDTTATHPSGKRVNYKRLPCYEHCPGTFGYTFVNMSTQYNVVCRTIPNTTSSLGWWITNWNLQRTTSNKYQHILTTITRIYVLLNCRFLWLWLHLCIGSDTFILPFCTSNASELCILYPWTWPHGWPKHVADNCTYKTNFSVLECICWCHYYIICQPI